VADVRAVLPAPYVPEETHAALWQYSAPLIVTGIVMIPISLWLLRLAKQYTKRTEKLKRNG
jgi:hypothetical protein